jgi:hypothetical protein
VDGHRDGQLAPLKLRLRAGGLLVTMTKLIAAPLAPSAARGVQWRCRNQAAHLGLVLMMDGSGSLGATMEGARGSIIEEDLELSC